MRELPGSISPIQKAIWFKQNLYPDSPIFNIGGYFDFFQSIDETAFEKACAVFFDNSDVIDLVKAYTGVGGKSGKLYSCKFLDFSDKANPSEEGLAWMKNDMRTKMDLDHSLIDGVIIKLSSASCYVYFKAHHLIIDGFGYKLMLSKVSGIYNKIRNGQAIDPSDTGFKFSDFIKDYQRYESSEEYKTDRYFWLEKLEGQKWNKGFASVLRPKQKTSLAAARKEITLQRDQFNEIEKFCKTTGGCTIFHYFISLVLILNDKYNNDSFVLGLPVFNRKSHAHKNTMGLFMNILPFYVEVLPDDTLKSILLKVKNETRSSYRHQSFPLFNLHDELNLSGTYFNVLFSYQKIEHDDELFNGKARPLYLNCGEQDEDITFHVIEYFSSEDVTLAIDYKTDLFNEDSINKLIRDFKFLMDYLFRNADQAISGFTVLSPEDEKAIDLFNQTGSALPVNKTFTDLFEEQVKTTPDNPAVIFNELTLSYKELNEISNRLAHYIRSRFDIRANDLIGIKMNRNHQLLITVLSVLKAGAAYIPVDTSFSDERTSFILKDSGCKLLLDENFMSEFNPVASEYPQDDPVKIISPDNLAYIIYTSGSTGTPKGTMIEHAGLLNHLLAMKQEFKLDENSRVVQNASYTFDISVWQLLNALITGGTTIIFDKETILHPEIFLKKINDLKATVLQVVPSYLKSMLDFVHADTKLLSSLKYLSVTGEAVTHQLLRHWFSLFPSIKVVNAYGPAEASDDVTLHIMDKLPEDANIPVGKPVQNVKIYILDKAGKHCPIGIEGEIYVSGIAVGRGYINDSKKTSESFLTDPFIGGPVRMYKTGDMGRWLQNGTVEFTGRKDDQVKIRGYRIELGEIEHALFSAPGVKDAVVIVKQNNDEKYIVAYVITENGTEAGSLRLYLDKKLPSYMIPAFFIRLDKFPLNSNGKIDKKKLPDPQTTKGENHSYIAPETETQKKLAVIWSDILGKKDIGIKDNFLELGGHSLKAVKVISRIQETFDVKISIASFLAEGDIESQAKYLDTLACLDIDAVPGEELLF